MRNTLILIILGFFGATALGAIPIHQVSTEKRGHYLESGVFVGGRSQEMLELLNFRQSFNAASGVERLVLDIGHHDGHKPALRPGFFHISVQKESKRLLIDLENADELKTNETDISKALEKSKFFAGASVYVDSLSHHLTLELPLKSRAKVEAFELTSPGKPGRIVIDVKHP